ncbi:unnamed protein product [Soboliphyme baturini]|uniref:MTS domain-containing protein n=1 Tax=Soboliphyme baturini TaxID=241478 RepID=A0A183J591_9BILA|nr:unnamed protein product [Soboliphyme baturini]
MDKEEAAVNCARRNVEVNNMQDYIRVVKVNDECSFYDVVSSSSIPCFHFLMCNPPFYSSATESMSISRERRPKPHSATTAKPVEVYAEGGEIVFIGKIIEDSFKLQKKVRIYTSMIGKKTSLGPIKNKLKELHVIVTVFSLSVVRRWLMTGFHCRFLRCARRRFVKERRSGGRSRGHSIQAFH